MKRSTDCDACISACTTHVSPQVYVPPSTHMASSSPVVGPDRVRRPFMLILRGHYSYRLAASDRRPMHSTKTPAPGVLSPGSYTRRHFSPGKAVHCTAAPTAFPGLVPNPIPWLDRVLYKQFRTLKLSRSLSSAWRWTGRREEITEAFPESY
jgi:hypothetical protein